MMAHLLLRSTIGVFVLFASNGALAYAAHLVARRFFSAEPPAARWAAAGIAFVAFVLVITQALSALSLYNRPVVVLSCVAVAGLVHRLWGRHRNFTVEIEPLGRWLRAVVDSRGAVLLCAATLAVLLAAGRGLTVPPLSWDSLTYHLFFGARYVQLGRLAGFDGPPMMDHYDHFPINGEMMAAWLLLPFGTDLLVGLLSFPFLALGAVALYGLCREVGARWDEASLAACLVCFSPFLFAYLTTQDVDIQAFAVVMCGALFVLRYLRAQRAACAVAACTAIGIAAGTKYTALALDTMLFATLVVAVVLHHAPRKNWRALGTTLSCGLLLAGVVGAHKYVENWRDTGNPVYPIQATLAGHQIFAGSSYTNMMAEKKELGSRRDDLTQFVDVFNYFPTWRLPTSGGPKFPLLLILALGAVVWATRDRERWPVLLLAAYGFLGVCAVYLPGDGFPALARRLWPGAASRFLAAPFALLVVAAMPAVGKLRARVPALLGILSAFTFWDMMVANTSVAPSFPLAVGVGSVVVVSVALCLPSRRWSSRLPTSVRVGLLAIAAVASAALLQEIRDRDRWLRDKESTDVSPIPRAFIGGWEYCDRPDHPRRIALVAGWEYRGQNFFFYPLVGSRLQNTVVYIPPSPPDPPSQPGTNANGSSDAHGFGAWVGKLHQEQVDTVFVEEPWPTEDTWMRAHPETFAVLKAGDAFRIYSVAGNRREG